MKKKHLPEKPGLESGIGGELIGRDPRKMSAAELTTLGHKPCSPLAALRARCVDRCAGSAPEVRKCVAVDCPAWPFRMRKSPWRAPPSEAKREAGRTLAVKRALAPGTQRLRRSLRAKSGVPGTHPPEKSYPQGNAATTGGGL